MCGIVGIYSLDNSKIFNLKSRLKKMIELIDYRGPDNTGYYVNDISSFGMANNQLSIVSPNKKIKLPVTYDDNTYLSFNGEIYNYLDLKNKYKVANKHFIFKTDTEILYNFLNNPSKDFSDLNGPWAFAFYNKKEHTLQLGRDILGERNLYYYINNNELIFSSEIRPIFKANKINFSIDNIGLQDMWRYYSCRENRTVIKDCFKLVPGKIKIFNSKIRKKENIREINLPLLEIDKYSDFFSKSSEKEIQKKFDEIFFDEVNLRFPKLVNLHSFLSGGIDSSYMNLTLNKSKKLNTLYAISSKLNSKIDNYYGISELQLSEIVSKAICSKHTIVDLRDKFYKEAKRVTENSLETLDPSLLNFSMLAKRLKNLGTKVAFASDGPDEFLCGYTRDILNYYENKKNFEKIPYHKIIKDNNFYKSIFKKVENKTNFFSEPDKRYKKYFKDIDRSQYKALTYASKSLPEFINIRADKGFMLNSIEVRQPYLSKKIVEFLCGLPEKFRVSEKNKFGKLFMRRIIKRKFKQVSNFPKTGFGRNLISDEKVYKKMSDEINDTINDKKTLDKINFKKDCYKIFLKENNSQKMMLFSILRSINNLTR